MKLTSKTNRITVRLDNDLAQNLHILHNGTKTDKAKLVRMILNDFFEKNEQLLDQYYEETKNE